MATNAPLTRRIQTAIDALPPAHRLPPSDDEVVSSLEAGKLRLQDYAFTQGFALVVETNDKKHGRLVLHCNRHKTKTKDWRKLSEEDKEKGCNGHFI